MNEILELLKSQVFVLGIIGVVVIIGLFGLIVRFVRKVEPGTVGVKTGVGKLQVVTDYTLVFPIIHQYEVMDISVKRLEITRQAKEGLICQDNLRADISVAFYIRVDQNHAKEVAQAVGCARASELPLITQLFEAKFSEALKTAGKKFNFTELYTERTKFKDAIIEVIGTDLNGYRLEDVAIDYLEQTPLEFLDPDNVLDSQGIRLITEITSTQAQEANLIQRNKEKVLKKQNVEAAEAILELEKQQAEATERQQREIASIQAREQSEAKQVMEEERKKAEKARIDTEQEIGIAEENKHRQIIVAAKNKERTDAIESERVEKDRSLEEIERLRVTTLAQIEKEKTIEVEKKDIQEVIRQRVELEKTVVEERERMKDTEAIATANRQKQVAVTHAEQQAEESLVKDIKAAEAQRKATELKAQEDKYKTVLDAEAARESAELIAQEKIILAESEEQASIKLAKARLHEAEGISSIEAAKGVAEAQVTKAKADADKVQGEIEAKVLYDKYQAEAKGMTEKAEAMKLYDEVGKDHEEFKLRLNLERDVEIAKIETQKDIAEQQAILVSEGLRNAKIDIVGGESVFFDKLVQSISNGKSIDSMTNNSQVLSDIKNTFFNGDPEYFKSQIAQWVKDFGIPSNDLKNLTMSALLGRMISQSKNSDITSLLGQALQTIQNKGLGDQPANSLLSKSSNR